MILNYIFIGILGLIIGSFLNVCIYRIPVNKSIVSPPSSCGNCQKRLRAIDLIPVLSYIIQKGKCRYCGKKFSIRYLVVELVTSFIFLTLYNKFSKDILVFSLYAYFISILIVVFFIDLDHKIIPFKLVVSGLIGGGAIFVYNIFNNVELYSDDKWWNPLIGMVAGSGFLFLVALIGLFLYKTDDAMGMGDVNIFAPIGLYLGWRLTFLTLFMSVIIAGVFSIFLLILRIKQRKDGIPFGPFIVTAVLISILFGNSILNWYLSIGVS